MHKVQSKKGELTVSTARVARMADRAWKLGKARRANFIAAAKARLDAQGRKRDAAIVAAGGGAAG